MRFLRNFPRINKRSAWNRSGGLENFSNINKQGDDYWVLESTLRIALLDPSAINNKQTSTNFEFITEIGMLSRYCVSGSSTFESIFLDYVPTN